MRKLLVITLALLWLPTITSAASLSKPGNNLGLVGYWSMNEGTSTIAHDFSGYKDDGALQNAPVWTYGKLSSAISLNGSNQYVSLGSPSTPTGAVTITAWIYKTANKPWASILDRYGSETLDCLGLGLDNSTGSKLMFIYNASSASGWANKITASTALPNNQWIFVAVSSDGSNATFYVNGVSDGTAAVGPVCNTGPLEIGVDFPGSDEYFQGKIDEVRLYNRGLTALEIAALYQVGSARVQSGALGLVGHWAYDESSGSTAYDTSGRGHNGTLVASTTRVTGKFGGALSTNVSGTDKVTINVDLGSAWTAMSWFYYPLATVGGGWWTLFRGSNDHQVLVQRTTSQPLGMYDNTGATGFHASGFNMNTLATGWHHLAAVGHNGVEDFYIDGAYVGQSSVESTSDIQSIGNCPCNSQNWGTFDDTRIYNRALTAAEIYSIYSASAQGRTVANASSASLQNGSSLNQGLAGFWTFDGADMTGSTALDKSGNGNTGTLVNSPKKTIGKLGQAMSFAGTTTASYVTLGSPSSLDISGDISISAWVRPTFLYASTGAKNPIVTARTTSSVTPYDFGVYANGIELDMHLTSGGDANGFQTTHFATAIPLNGWTHVVVTRSSTTISAYKNGALVGTASLLGPVDPTSNGVQIGKDFYDTTYYFNGALDDIRIYNRVLSATEVKQLYNLGK